MASEFLTEEQWGAYDRDGFVVLDGVASLGELADLNARLDDLMLGRITYGEALIMQLDPTSGSTAGLDIGSYDEKAAYQAKRVELSQTAGFKGPSMAYRKIGEAQAGLECDPLFHAFMQKPLFRGICDRVYGAHAGIAVYRAMAMCKPSDDLGGGTPLPWHQDGGDWWALDRDPLCFVWLALSPATTASGAVQVVKGSHRLGLLSLRGHTLSSEDVARVVDDAPPGAVVDVQLAPGQAFLCHNFTVHRSGTNTTREARRGFSVNYIDARTRVLDPKPALAGDLGTPGCSFPVIFPSKFAPA